MKQKDVFMKVEMLDKKNFELYENFLSLNEGATLYYSIKYKCFLERILNCSSEYYVAWKDNKICGILPLMYKKGNYGKVYNTLPFYGSNGGVLASCKEAYKVLINKFEELVASPGVASSNYIENPLFESELKTDLLSDEVDCRIGQFTPLEKKLGVSESIDDFLMKSFHTKTRNMIRKALKCDIEVEVNNNEIGFVNKVHVDNMTEIGGKPKSNLFFNEIETFFEEGKDYKIYIAKKEGKKIAALLLFYYNKTVEYFTPVIESEYRSLQPMSVLIYQAMIDASIKGFKYWNWGGTWKSQEGVFRFKNRWNTKNIEYKYYIRINNKKIYQSSKSELLSEYPDFFVLPFDKLNN